MIRRYKNRYQLDFREYYDLKFFIVLNVFKFRIIKYLEGRKEGGKRREGGREKKNKRKREGERDKNEIKQKNLKIFQVVGKVKIGKFQKFDVFQVIRQIFVRCFIVFLRCLGSRRFVGC